MSEPWNEAIDVLSRSGVAVLPTDTIFGVVGSALSKNTVERIYKIKGRNDGKPLVVLISSYDDLNKFNIKAKTKIGENWNEALKDFWPGKVSVILPCPDKNFAYLHRGLNSIAFRMVGPRNRNLFKLLNEVGPIVAPSANPEGLKPAKNITEAKNYFGIKVDCYVPGVVKNTNPSTLIDYNQGEIKVLRKGVAKIKNSSQNKKKK